MTLVGKILIVVHLFLSVLFMAFAGAVYTAQTNWKTEVDKQQKQSAKLKADLQAAQTEAERQKTTDAERITALDAQLMDASVGRDNLQTENTRLLAENKSLRVQFDAEREAARLNSIEADERVQETVLQREKNQLLYTSRNELVKQVRTLEDQLFQLNVQNEQADQKNKQLVRDMATMRAFLVAKGLPADPKQMTAQSAPLPEVRGLVLDARRSDAGGTELVEISIGSDDGLNVGNVLTLYSQDKYLGQIRLVYVTPDRSVGSVVTKAKNTTIQKGDNVTTEL